MRNIVLLLIGIVVLFVSGCGGDSNNSIVAPGYEEVKPLKPEYTKPAVIAPGYKKIKVPSKQKGILPSKKYSKMPIDPKL